MNINRKHFFFNSSPKALNLSLTLSHSLMLQRCIKFSFPQLERQIISQTSVILLSFFEKVFCLLNVKKNLVANDEYSQEWQFSLIFSWLTMDPFFYSLKLFRKKIYNNFKNMTRNLLKQLLLVIHYEQWLTFIFKQAHCLETKAYFKINKCINIYEHFFVLLLFHVIYYYCRIH